MHRKKEQLCHYLEKRMLKYIRGILYVGKEGNGKRWKRKDIRKTR